MIKKLSLAILFFISLSALAKPITVTLMVPPGGVSDKVWRTLLPMLVEELPEYSFVTDYRPGGGGAVAATYVSSQPNTHLFLTTSSIAISAASNSSATHRAEDFKMLGYLGTMPMMLVVSNKLPNTVPEFIKYCKSHNLNMASPGSGSTLHFASKLIMKSLNCSVTDVPYKGPGLALADLVSNRIDFMFDFTAGAAQGLVQDGKIKNIMIIGNQRSSDFPGVLTSRELKINTDSVKSWIVILANAQADASDVYVIQQALNRIFSKPEYMERFNALGLEGTGTKVSPTFLKDSFEFYRRFVDQ